MIRAWLKRHWHVVGCGVALLFPCGWCPGQGTGARHDEAALPAGVSALLPRSASVDQVLRVRFARDEPEALAVTYVVPEEDVSRTLGLLVVRHGDGSGWTEVFRSSIPGSKGHDTLELQRVTSLGGREGVLAVHQVSGAGIVTEWKVVAEARGRVMSLDPAHVQRGVLRRLRYAENGYNRVTAAGDAITEEQPGYSLHRARCCPDRPTIQVRYRFAGDSLELVGVKKLPFHLQE